MFRSRVFVLFAKRNRLRSIAKMPDLTVVWQWLERVDSEEASLDASAKKETAEVAERMDAEALRIVQEMATSGRSPEFSHTHVGGKNEKSRVFLEERFFSLSLELCVFLMARVRRSHDGAHDGAAADVRTRGVARCARVGRRPLAARRGRDPRPCRARRVTPAFSRKVPRRRFLFRLTGRKSGAYAT